MRERMMGNYSGWRDSKNQTLYHIMIMVQPMNAKNTYTKNDLIEIANSLILYERDFPVFKTAALFNAAVLFYLVKDCSISSIVFSFARSPLMVQLDGSFII